MEGRVKLTLVAGVEHRFAGDQRQLDPALHPRAVEGRVPAARAQQQRVDDIGFLGIEPDKVGRRAGFEPALWHTQDLGRAGRHRLQELGQRHLAGDHQPQRGRQHGLDADRARLAFGEGQALVEGVASGLVDVIVSDHNPQDVEVKRLPFAECEPAKLEHALVISKDANQHYDRSWSHAGSDPSDSDCARPGSRTNSGCRSRRSVER